MIYFLIILIGYIIGSISPSIIVTNYLTGKDIRNFGSGNAGATNVFRVLGWKIGVPVFIFDVFKNYFSILLLPEIILGFLNETQNFELINLKILIGISVIVGHIWTVFGNFRGGKGVATMLGFMLALAPIDFLFTILVFFIFVGVTKYISLGSIISSISFPIILYCRENIFHQHVKDYNSIIIITIIIPLLIIFTHRNNIKRIMNGNENKFSFAKKTN